MIRQISLKPRDYLWAPQKPFLLKMGFIASTDNISFTFEDEGRKACLCIEEEEDISINKGTLPEIWNELMKLNFTKIINENESIVGLDGYELIVGLRSGLNEITVTLWNPSESIYKEYGMTESAAFMNCVNRLIKLAADNNVEVRLDCE